MESLAERAGVPAQAFRNLEAGEVEMSFLTVLDYCHALDVDLPVGPRYRRLWLGDAPPSVVDLIVRTSVAIDNGLRNRRLQTTLVVLPAVKPRARSTSKSVTEFRR